jgi:peptidoglycan hydrolase-like protein with peptidoglycan-binding domain
MTMLPKTIARRLASVGIGVAILMSVTAPAALANHQAPRNGTVHDYGAMVDYPLVFPVVGPYRWTSDGFWSRRGSGVHHAQDIMADKMTPVVAAAGGVIIRINGSSVSGSTGPTNRCCSMAIRHDDRWESVYIHLNNDTPGTDDGLGWGIAPGLAVGTRVTAGQHIGWVGDSGNAENTAPHLHYELYDNERIAVNSYNALRAAEGKAPAAAVGTGSCQAPSAGDLKTLASSKELLREGSRGEAVRDLQRFLSAIGTSVGSIDGVFGPLTRNAVRQFQSMRGITADGIVGPQSIGEITTVNTILPATSVLATNARILRPGYRGADVQNLQQLLHVAGHSPGAADGVYGPLTEAAVRSFQSARGITVDGRVGPQTRNTLSTYLGLDGLRTCA